MNTTNVEKNAKVELLKKTWEYLNDNFYKFSETNKIKIALALNTRQMANEKDEGKESGDTKIIIVRSGEQIPNDTRIEVGTNTVSRQIPV